MVWVQQGSGYRAELADKSPNVLIVPFGTLVCVSIGISNSSLLKGQISPVVCCLGHSSENRTLCSVCQQVKVVKFSSLQVHAAGSSPCSALGSCLSFASCS